MRLYLLTRIWVALAVVAVRTSPLLVALATGAGTTTHWGTALGLTLLLQPLFFLAERRCASDDMTHWRGMLLVGAAMNTGWTYLDAIFVTAGVLAAYLASCVIALLPQPEARFAALLRSVHRHRMEQ